MEKHSREESGIRRRRDGKGNYLFGGCHDAFVSDVKDHGSVTHRGNVITE